MKKNAFLTAGAIAVIIGVVAVACKKDPTTPTTPTTPSDVHLKSGLLLYLPFDGNFADSSGNGNVSTPLSNTSLAPDEHGYSNQAFGGNGGSNTALYVTNNGSIKWDSTMTYSYNFMVLAATPLQCFLSIVDPATGYGPSFASGLTMETGNKLSWGTADSSNGCGWFAVKDPRNVTDTANFVPAPGSWYNVIGSYSNGTIKTYVNGKLVSTKTGAGHKMLLCPNSKVIVGGWFNSSEPVNGRLDEVRLYNRLLNDNEIKELAKDFQD
jgi:hypothetical protein